MGTLIRYTPDPFRPNVADVRRAPSGLTALDTVRATFPDLMDAPLILLRNGIRLQGDEVLSAGDVVTVAEAPGGPETWTMIATYAVKAVVFAAVSYLINQLFAPKTKQNKQRSPAYSVNIDQNAARLGGTLPVIYGRVMALPDIAAQPYSEFVGHNERASMILCLGMGEFEIHDILIGDARAVDFPPGTVQAWIFKPGDHFQQLGRIEAITGVCEDMLTIPETAGIDLAAPNDPAEVAVAGQVSGGVLTPNNPAESQLWTGLVPGKAYVVTNSAGGSTVVNYVGQGPNNSAVFDGPLPTPPAVTWLDTPLQLTPIDDAQEGRMMLLYTQRELPALNVDEIIYVDDWPYTTRLGPFQIARIEVRATRMYLRMTGLGFETATGEQGFWPMRNGAVVRNAYVTYYVAEYVPGADPGEQYRWRGWYASCRPGLTVDRIFVDIQLPSGIAWITDKGDYKTTTVTLLVDIQQIDDNGNAIGGLRREVIRISGATSDPRRISYKYDVGVGRYRIRVARQNTRDQRASKEVSATQLAAIRTRIHHALYEPAYENCTLVVMQFAASAGLSAASNRRIRVDCTRKLWSPWTSGAMVTNSDNPAIACWDAYTNTDYGGAHVWQEFDLAKFGALLPQWDTVPGFNGVFDQPTTLIEALQGLLTPVRAIPLPVGRMLSVSQDAPRERQFVFGPDTVITGSQTIGYNFDGEDVPDCLEVIYTKPDTFVEGRIYYPSQGVRPETMELFGCTSEAHAIAWAQCVWQDRAYARKTCEIELEAEGYLLQPLDRFAVAVPSIHWSTTGYVLQFNPVTNEVVLDMPLPPQATAVAFKDRGKLTTPVALSNISADRYTVTLVGPPPVTVQSANQYVDGTQFMAATFDYNLMDFAVANLETSGALRVKVTGRQYSPLAYAGTFVQNWTTG